MRFFYRRHLPLSVPPPDLRATSSLAMAWREEADPAATNPRPSFLSFRASQAPRVHQSHPPGRATTQTRPEVQLGVAGADAVGGSGLAVSGDMDEDLCTRGRRRGRAGGSAPERVEAGGRGGPGGGGAPERLGSKTLFHASMEASPFVCWRYALEAINKVILFVISLIVHNTFQYHAITVLLENIMPVWYRNNQVPIGLYLTSLLCNK